MAEAQESAEARFEQQLVLLKKDAEAEKRVSALQVKALEQTIAHQAAQLDGLGKQLDEAKRQVQDIAVKAIEGASGARALERVNQIAIEQAKMRGAQGWSRRAGEGRRPLSLSAARGGSRTLG